MLEVVTLLKDWTHAGVTYKTGQTLECDAGTAGELIQSGTAEALTITESGAARSIRGIVRDTVEELRQEGAHTARQRRRPYVRSSDHESNAANGNGAPNGDGSTVKAVTTVGSTIGFKSYRQLLDPEVSYPKSPFRSFGDFLRAVKKNNARLQQWDASTKDLSTFTGAAGGYLVPIEMSNDLFTEGPLDSIMAPRARGYPLTGHALEIPAVVISDRDDGFAHVRAAWTAEGAAITQDDPQFRGITLRPRKLAVRTVASNESLDDSQAGVSIGAAIQNIFAEELSYRMDEGFIRGNGATEPLGILNSPALVSVSRDGANAISFGDVCTMFAALYMRSRGRAIWIVSQDALLTLLTMTQTIGNAGIGMWSTLGQSDGELRLLGKPVFVSDHGEALGTPGDILLIDPTQYAIGARADVRVESSPHVNFTTDQTAFRAIARVDGSPLWNTSLTLRVNNATVSPFVALAAG